MTFCAAERTPQIFPARVLRSRQEPNPAVKAVLDTTLQLVIGIQEGVERRLILTNKPIDRFAVLPICPIREKLPDRDQEETGSPLQCQYCFSHPRPTSSTLMRRVEGRGIFMRQQNEFDKNSLNPFPLASFTT